MRLDTTDGPFAAGIEITADFALSALGESLGESRSSFEADVVQYCVPWGILVVDPQKEVLFANRRARTMLEAALGLEQHQGRVRAERACVDRSIADLVRWAASGGVGEAPSGTNTIGVPDRTGRTRYAVKVLPCGHRDGTSAALIVISDLVSEVHVNRATVARLFQLSAREADFAELFASGLRIDAIAALMGISINTARIHLRHVFQKTACANQIELARTFARMP